MEVNGVAGRFQREINSFQDVLEAMLTEMKAQKQLLKDQDRDLQEKRDLIALYLRERNEARGQIQSLKTSRLSERENPFVVVLVDADHMLFESTFLKQGRKGGRQAARALRRAIDSFIESDARSIAKNSKVIVKAYANCYGLESYLNFGNNESELIDLQEFFRGFNQGDSLFEFIDVGDGKERTDIKLKSNFDIFIEDVHCQNVILAASGDGGYARLLEPFVDDEKKRNKITMLEGPLFVRELAELSKDFICTSFEGVFSSKSSAKHKPSSPTVTSEVTQPNYAAVAKNASPSTLQSPITGISQARKLNCKILRNKNGERVDEYVIHSPAIEYKLLPKRLCHRHHLLGHCNFNRCQHQSTHQLAINDEEWRALRNIARRSLCLKGLSCSERNCVLGHQCVKNCPKIGAGCRFPESLHGVDTQVVSVE